MGTGEEVGRSADGGIVAEEGQRRWLLEPPQSVLSLSLIVTDSWLCALCHLSVFEITQDHFQMLVNIFKMPDLCHSNFISIKFKMVDYKAL